jgi:outer membrane protein assembly factor BamB
VSNSLVVSGAASAPRPFATGRRERGFVLIRAITCVALLGFAFTPPLPGSDWPRFRGPNGGGVSPDRGLPSQIDPEGSAVWSVSTPKGSSSPIVIDGRVYLTAHEGEERITLCHDTATGALAWRRSIVRSRAENFHPRNGPTTPTPATDGRRVFVFFPEFGLLSYDRDGQEVWRVPLGPFVSIQGLAASPVYVSGKVVLLVDTPEEAYLSAYDADTGEPVWRTERPTGVLGSYATPTLWAPEGGPTRIVVAGARELTGYDAETGRRHWWVGGLTVFPTAPPFVAGNAVYTVEPVEAGWPPFGEVLSLFDHDKDGQVALKDAADDVTWARSLIGIDRNIGDGDGIVTRQEYAQAASGVIGGGLARTRVDGEGDVSATHVVWRQTRGMPSLTGALLYQDVLYVVRNAIVSTFDPETGQRLRRERIRRAVGEYYASPVAGDGKIYLVSLDGKVTVLRAGTDWEVLSTADLGEQVIATPAIANGRVYVRTEGTLYCFGPTSSRQPPVP